MAKYLMAVQSRPTDGREDECTAWYKNVHVKDVGGGRGITSGRLFALVPSSPGKSDPYLALYEIESDDIDATMTELRGRAGSAYAVSDAHDRASVKVFLYKAL